VDSLVAELVRLEKAKRGAISSADRRLDTAARSVQPRLERWLRKATNAYAKEELRRLTSRSAVRRLAKAQTLPDLDKELLDILNTFGLRQAIKSGRAAMRGSGSEWVIEPKFVDDFLKHREFNVASISGETRRKVQGVIRRVLRESLTERPLPSINEMSRRIRVELSATVLSVEAIANRAEQIARTEAATAENAGIAQGFKLAGIDEIEWLAHTDGKSGDRHHEKMNGKRISVEDAHGDDTSKWFKTPKGNRLRWPLDPEGAIEDTVRCRCTMIPVVNKGNRKLSSSRAKLKGPRSGAVGRFK